MYQKITYLFWALLVLLCSVQTVRYDGDFLNGILDYWGFILTLCGMYIIIGIVLLVRSRSPKRAYYSIILAVMVGINVLVLPISAVLSISSNVIHKGVELTMTEKLFDLSAFLYIQWLPLLLFLTVLFLWMLDWRKQNTQGRKPEM